MTRLGPFELDRVIGQGGMGQIWLAHHVRDRTPAAVKVDLHPRGPQYAAAFLHEVQVVAGLDSPHVVQILEHGEVSASAAAVHDSLKEGNRWLAMELAAGGALSDLPPRTWAEVVHVMIGLMKGLAVAHSHGLVHRDVKAGNLLLAGPEPGVTIRPASLLDARVVLSDFGVSGDTASHAHSTSGTPKLMAPEQVLGLWRDQGPWTDVYAAGILMWKLTTGSYPFAGKNAFHVLKQHVNAPPPRFRPRMNTPDGLEDLLLRMLAKQPRSRLDFAADVIHELERLGTVEPGDVTRMPVDMEDQDTVSETLTSGTSASAFAAMAGFEGAGLSLWGLRTPPLIGRQPEMEVLDGALATVRASGRARVVLLRGNQGVGKTRLALEFARQSHQRGDAWSFEASAVAGGAKGASLLTMVQDLLKCGELDEQEQLRRVADVFGDTPTDAKAVLSLVSGAPHLRGAWRHALIQSILTGWTRGRPLIVVLDALEYDEDFIEWTDHLLAGQRLRPSPILVLVTGSDESLSDESLEAVADWADDPCVQTLPVRPLDAHDHRELLMRMITLDGRASEAVERHTAGHPLFAKQLIGAWLDQGVLESGRRGLTLTREPGVPEAFQQVWTRRIADLELPHPEVLEAAALQGIRVNRALWTATSGSRVDEVMAVLLARHLARIDESGSTLIWTHPLMVSALHQRCRDSGRWAGLHEALGRGLDEVGGRTSAKALAWLEAGEVDRCIPLLSAAIDEQFDDGDLRSNSMFDAFERALDGRPPTDAWHGRLGVLRAIRSRLRGDHAKAMEQLEELRATARRMGWSLELGRALRESARCALYHQQAYDEAAAFAEEARSLFQGLHDERRVADCAKLLGDLGVRTGRFEDARAHLTACEATYRTVGLDALHTVQFSLAMLERRAGRPEAASRWLALCRETVEPLGLQKALAAIANLEGEIAREAGDVEQAIASYEQSAKSYRLFDSPQYAFPMLNIALLDLAAGRFDSARVRVLPVRADAVSLGRRLLIVYADLVMLVSAAGLGDREESDRALSEVETYLEERTVADHEIGHLCDEAGQAWKNTDVGLARRCLLIAHSQYLRTNRSDEAMNVALMLGDLQGAT